jgi:hypothetical protein
MPAANVPLVIDQGEDFTAQVIWTDDQGQAQRLVEPMRLDIKGAGNQPILSLTTPETEAPDGTIPEISYSSEIGMIQLHIPKEQTAALLAGLYKYDMFVTVNDGDEYAGNQQFRLLVGQVIVNQRITVM